MQFFSVSLAEVRTVKHANPITFDSATTKKPAMEKIITNPWYVKKYIVQLLFIALMTIATFLKRLSGGKVIHIRF